MRNAATTPNGVLGSKMMRNDFDWLRSSFRPVSGTDRYRQQADAATERYVDLVRSAMLSG
jgi:LPS sulfotransferase NodH